MVPNASRDADDVTQPISHAAPGERLVVIEDVAELRIAHPHVIGLQTRQPNVEGAGGVDLRRLVREALRVYLSARLIPAELPTPAEARAYRRGMAAYRRGDSITLQEYVDGMDRRPSRSRKKVS